MSKAPGTPKLAIFEISFQKEWKLKNCKMALTGNSLILGTSEFQKKFGIWQIITEWSLQRQLTSVSKLLDIISNLASVGVNDLAGSTQGWVVPETMSGSDERFRDKISRDRDRNPRDLSRSKNLKVEAFSLSDQWYFTFL